MTTFKTEKIKIKNEGESISIIKKENFDTFSEDILGLGKIDMASIQTNAISVIFDLEGFTNFCKQIDPQLAVPEYLSEFLKWIFSEVKVELINKTYKEGYDTWADLPFISKFLGDGVLFLWDTQNMHEDEILNVVVSMYEICKKYTKVFLPKISKSIISPPEKLRCGIARGAIYSVGNGNDYVGPCINMSARLQKLNSLSFCFSRRGLSPSKMSAEYQALFDVKKVNIRGIGDTELVCILKSEYLKLDKSIKEKFID